MNKQRKRQLSPSDPDDDVRERTFLLTDCCLWELNKGRAAYYPHAIEVVDVETGQTRYIKSGSTIQFVAGSITPGRDQAAYNTYEVSPPTK